MRSLEAGALASMFHVVMRILGVTVVVVVEVVEDVQLLLVKWYQGCGVGTSNSLRVFPISWAIQRLNSSRCSGVCFVVDIVFVVVLLCCCVCYVVDGFFVGVGR